MSTGADMTLMAGGISAMGIQMNAETQAQNIRQQGQDQLFQYEYAAGQNLLAEKMARIKASQTDTYMRRRADEDIGNAQAMMAMDGSDPNSPSSQAVVNALQGRNDEAREQSMWNTHLDAENQKYASSLQAIQGYKAMNVATYNSIATIATGQMAAMGAMMSAVASADQMRTQKAQARFSNMISMASGALGVVGKFGGIE